MNHNTSLEHSYSQKKIAFTVFIILCVCSLFIALMVNKILKPRMLTDAELRAQSTIIFDIPRQITPFRLTDHTGSAFTEANLQGHWSVLYFGFTSCPDICPATLAQLNQYLLTAENTNAPQVVMVSVDPARDTPEILGQYMGHFNAEFLGVTGEFKEIMKLTQSVGVAFRKVSLADEQYTIDHTCYLVMINPKGHFVGFIKPPFSLAKFNLVMPAFYSKFGN